MEKLLSHGISEETMATQWFGAADDSVGSRFRTFIDCLVGQSGTLEEQQIAREVQKDFLEGDTSPETLEAFCKALQEFEQKHVSTTLH